MAVPKSGMHIHGTVCDALINSRPPLLKRRAAQKYIRDSGLCAKPEPAELLAKHDAALGWEVSRRERMTKHGIYQVVPFRRKRGHGMGVVGAG